MSRLKGIIFAFVMTRSRSRSPSRPIVNPINGSRHVEPQANGRRDVEAEANSTNTGVNDGIDDETQLNGGSSAQWLPEDGRTRVLLRACQAMSTLQVAIGVVQDTRVDLDDSHGCPANFWPFKVRLMDIEEKLREVRGNMGRLYQKALTEPDPEPDESE